MTEKHPAVQAPTGPAARTSRLAALDGFRLLAALAVAVYHFTVSWRVDGHTSPDESFGGFAHVSIYGFLGVEVFFMISGFVICMSGWGRSLGDFFTSRVSRLYPAYWVCVLITAVVVTAAPIAGGLPVAGTPSLAQIAANLTMLHEPLGIGSVDTVYWTLFVELRFYLLFAVLAAFGLTYRRVIVFCAVWMTVALLAPALDSRLVDVLAVPEYAPYFIAGMVIYLIHRFGRTPLLLAMTGFTWLISVPLVTARVADLDPGFDVPAWPGVLIVSAGFGLLLAIASGWTDRIRWGWLTTAGAVTYPFYLLHQRIGYTMIRRAHEATGLPAWLLVTGTVVTLLVAAWLVYRFMEKPLASRLRNALRQSLTEVRAAAPAAGR
jgi:peptidoglycan/LPS O-acetylase OafA/YrhL